MRSIILWTVIFLGYFALRFGMVSRGRWRDLIQFAGGMILTIALVLIFVILGIKIGIISILIFCFIITPITELIIIPVKKSINKPYKEIHEYLAKKYNKSPEGIENQIYKNME